MKNNMVFTTFKKMFFFGLAFLIFLFLLSSNTYAKCRSSNVCDDYGQNCRVVDICDNTLDLPSLGLPPIRSLPTLKLKPLPSLNLPPLGTSSCRYMQVNGKWQNVCR